VTRARIVGIAVLGVILVGAAAGTGVSLLSCGRTLDDTNFRDALPVPRPYGDYGKVTNWAVDRSLPDAVGAFIHFYVRLRPKRQETTPCLISVLDPLGAIDKSGGGVKKITKLNPFYSGFSSERLMSNRDA